MKKARVHEWSDGYQNDRTVCGQTVAKSRHVDAVLDLGDIERLQRCQNCERMRSAIGTSRKRQGPAP